jgi:hypothetical protein
LNCDAGAVPHACRSAWQGGCSDYELRGMGLRWNKKASKEECRHPDKKVIAKFEHFFSL